MQASSKLAIRSPAPAFSGKAWWGNKTVDISLEQFKGKYVCLFWYPFDFTFVCPTEICAFNDKSPEFEKIGCQVIGASNDSCFVHREWTMKDRKKGGVGKLTIPLIGDVSRKIATDYGCLIEDGSAEHGATFRATYIIDPKGVLRHFSLNDLPIGRNVEESLRIVQALQFHEEHGDVCPANWHAGAPTMKGSHDAPETVAFFEKQL